MRCLPALALVAVIATPSLGNGICRVHAYIQEIIPGVAPSAGEGESFGARSHYEYHVYLECKQRVTPKLTAVRVRGKLYQAQVKPVDSPVVQFHPTRMQNDTLVAKTANRLFKIVLGRELSTSLRDTVGLSLSYVIRGKKYSYRTRTLTELSPIALP